MRAAEALGPVGGLHMRGRCGGVGEDGGVSQAHPAASACDARRNLTTVGDEVGDEDGTAHQGAKVVTG